MTCLVGLTLQEAEAQLAKTDTVYCVKETHAPKPLRDANDVRVLRQRIKNGRLEITVGMFKTEI